MKNKLILIILSFFLFSVPLFAISEENFSTCPADHSSTYIHVKFDNGSIRCLSQINYSKPFDNRFVFYFDKNYIYTEDNLKWTLLGDNSLNISLEQLTFSPPATNPFCTIISSNCSEFNTWLFENNISVGGGEVIPPVVAPVVGDLTEFIQVIVHTTTVILIVACGILSLMLSPRLVKLLFRFL